MDISEYLAFSEPHLCSEKQPLLLSPHFSVSDVDLTQQKQQSLEEGKGVRPAMVPQETFVAEEQTPVLPLPILPGNESLQILVLEPRSQSQSVPGPLYTLKVRSRGSIWGRRAASSDMG